MKGIDVKLLRAFVVLAEKGSYHQAADALYLTQPALSKQIKALESLVGNPLFHRGRHGAQLTETGNKLLDRAHQLLHSHADFIHYAKSINKEAENTLTLGVGISSFQCVPRWINAFRQKHPDCHVTLRHLPSSTQINMLHEGQLDAGFLRLPVPDTLAFTLIDEEQLILALPDDRSQDDLQRLLSSSPLLQIHPDASPCLAQQTRDVLQNIYPEASPISAADDIPSLLALIAGGNGVAILPASVRHFLPAGVTTRSLPGTQTNWQIGTAWNPRRDNTFRDAFLQIVALNPYDKGV
ncbi:LysR family transcriptional regulator [Kluyvera sp. M-M157-B]|uniref:LysR family transcriptional regulator n=1 Tax=Kluyvera sp. M-M157-B TaxID=3402291 RepID=UPI00387DBCEE